MRIGLPELIVIIIVAIALIKPEKLRGLMKNAAKAMKILKADFYIALSNFIEKFFVWLLEDKHINIDTYNYTPPVETEKPKLIEHNIEQIEHIEKEST